MDNIDTTHTQSFIYDDLDRLTNAQSTSYGSLSYAYDTIGNITSKRGVIYTYGGPRPHAVTETSGATPAPDRIFVHNDDNKPSSIDYNGDVTTFVYSGVGSSHNRAEKVATAATTVYIGSLYEKKGSSSSKYIFAGGTRVAVKTSTETYYYHQDHLGSTRVVTNSGGVKVEEIHYYPYGETLSDTGSVSVKHKFTSQALDSETGLYYYGARCYDPVLGRFTTADPIVPDPTNPQSLNRYSYVLNNPLKYTDPTGHGWFKKLKRWVKRLFRPKKIVRNIVKSVTSFSIQNAVTTAAQLSGYDPGGMLALTLRAASSFAASQLTDKALGNSGSLGRSGNYLTDDGTLISASSSGGDNFFWKGGSKRGNPSSGSRGLGYYGPGASTPKVNPTEQAEKRNKKTLQKSLSVDMEKTRKPHVGNLTFLTAGGAMIGFGSKLARYPSKLAKIVGFAFGAFGGYISGSVFDWWPLDPFDWVADVEKESYYDLTPIPGDI